MPFSSDLASSYYLQKAIFDVVKAVLPLSPFYSSEYQQAWDKKH